MSIVVELTSRGYLHISAEVAQEYFPHDALVALLRDGELWLLPTRGAAGGGLHLKQRNLAGDRSLLIHEILPDAQPGACAARWDEQYAALRVALQGD